MSTKTNDLLAKARKNDRKYKDNIVFPPHYKNREIRRREARIARRVNKL